MNVSQVAKFLIEGEDASSAKISVFVNRMMLRIYTVPHFMSALVDVGLDSSKEDGTTTVQLDFSRLPDEAVEPLTRLISAPSATKVLQYVKMGTARTGIEFDVKDSDLKGEDYDYAA